MKLQIFLHASLLTAGLFLLSALPSKAATCSTGSVTALGLGSATACIGSFAGNDAQGDGSGALLNQLSTGVFNDLTQWEFVGKSDEGAFDVTNGNSGSWNIASGITGPFVLSLKASTSWSAYFFEGLEDFQVFSGTWTTTGVSTNAKGTARALSHATLYRAVVETPPEITKRVPEPATTAALGLVAIGALGFLKKRV